MADEIALAAPAKLNLGLRVLGRRPDGYHEIESLLVPLDFGDSLHLCRRAVPGVALRLCGEAAQGVPAGPENLAWRAAQGFIEAAGLDFGVALRLEKRIPAPGGLGGGSSDAGAVLRGLFALAPCRAGALGAGRAGALRELALSLGADVPFFLDPRPALVEGIGERIQPLHGLPALDVAIAHPRLPLATGAVYAAFDAGPPPPPHPPLRRLLRVERPGRASLAGPGGAGPEHWPPPELLRNDLEAPARRLCPAVTALREALEAAGARAVGMSGSGPSVYGIFGSAAGARAAAQKLAASGFWSRAARSLPGPAGGESSQRGGRNAAE